MRQYQKKAFTLVELIVVITIIAILGTIAFISLQGYSAKARDSKRLSDVQNIKTSLELYYINTGKYPLPDKIGEVKYENELLRSQGTIGDNVSINLSKNLRSKPIDPLIETEYTYSTTQSQKEFQILSIYESDLYIYNNLLNKIYASTIYPKLDGNYNGVYVKSKTYYVPTPSIINSEVSFTGIILNEYNIKSQIINGGNNNLAYGNNPSFTGGLDGISLQAFSGTISKDNDDNKEDLAEKIILAYSGCTILSNNDDYNIIFSTSINDSSALIRLVDSLVLRLANTTQSSIGNCSSGQINGETYTGVNYSYGELIVGINLLSGVFSEDISNGTKQYLANLICNNGNVNIDSENIDITCDSGYEEIGETCNPVYLANNINLSGYTTTYIPDHAGGTSRFTDNGDGTISDLVTGLIWQKVADIDEQTLCKTYDTLELTSTTTSCREATPVYLDDCNWCAAKAYCANLELGGYLDWRLPDYTELQSILDYSSNNPSIDTNYFSCINGSYWTSSTYALSSTTAWALNYTIGNAFNSMKYNNVSVRCVY